ncbi:uncharacterized protein LOC133299416 [Gastrolobium bilobum]|uniref:uncharacterized protein LOC133299416 n=1 Tax=Gastrolobium bilobum TaxID=150636 RepID=UPI002AB14711|nr:uncharacterized protein LOC133299416 [Gastrolobium bilobum]
MSSEKGGEGTHSLSSEGGSPNGKDGSSTMSPKGKGVQFANEGGRSKGEKKGKIPKGVKIPMWKEPEPSDIEVGQGWPLADYGVSDSETCVIGNVCPETVDEVFAFVPSLEDKRSKIDVQVLKDVLSELAKLKAT